MNSEKKRCTAVVLAAGSGKRMGGAVPKQFMPLRGKPLLWYSLQAVEESRILDDCILVAGKEDISYVKREIVGAYGFRKVSVIAAGGRERYESVCNALRAAKEKKLPVYTEDGYLFIHDGARPFLTERLLEASYQAVCQYDACVAAVPVKDTIKIADAEGFAARTPDRSLLWAVQTPQTFRASLVIQAYERLLEQMKSPGFSKHITDDAMVVEEMLGHPVKLVASSYRNIKITTPEDVAAAEALLSQASVQQ